MIPGAIGAAFMAAGVLLGLEVAYGHLGDVATGALAAVAVWSLLGGGMLGAFAIGRGRIPHDDEGAAGPGDDDIERWIRDYRRGDRG